MKKVELSSLLKKKGFSSEKINGFFDSINDGLSISTIDKDLKDVREVVLWAVSNNGYCLEYVNEDFRSDREVVLWAVKNAGTSLCFANETLRNDKELVIVAVSGNGHALSYASDSLCGDKDVVLEAIKNTSASFQYANKELRDNKDFVLSAIMSARFIYKILPHISSRLKSDPEVMLLSLISVQGDKIKVNNTFKHASEELKCMVGEQDPLVVLKSIVEKEQLSIKIDTSCSNKKGIKI